MLETNCSLATLKPLAYNPCVYKNGNREFKQRYLAYKAQQIFDRIQTKDQHLIHAYRSNIGIIHYITLAVVAEPKDDIWFWLDQAVKNVIK